jgi:putative RNA 2'-phosphotransferase
VDHGRLSRRRWFVLRHRPDSVGLALDASGTRIRAGQGHSVAVALAYRPATPADVLFHGTVERFLPDVLTEGRCTSARTPSPHAPPADGGGGR